jgi:hypothetical protein
MPPGEAFHWMALVSATASPPAALALNFFRSLGPSLPNVSIKNISVSEFGTQKLGS